MWIREQSFDTSKRSDSDPKAVIAALAPILIGVLVSSCVVTDKIEFEDEVNYPPEVRRLDPSNDSVLTICGEGKHSFDIWVWDPDEKDADTLDSKLFLLRNPYSGGTWTQGLDCQVAIPGDEDQETGALLYVKCETSILGVKSGDLIIVKAHISDRGYVQNAVKEGARIVEVLWIVEIASEAACTG